MPAYLLRCHSKRDLYFVWDEVADNPVTNVTTLDKAREAFQAKSWWTPDGEERAITTGSSSGHGRYSFTDTSHLSWCGTVVFRRDWELFVRAWWDNDHIVLKALVKLPGMY